MGNHNSGRRGLPPETVAQVKQLLATGLSARRVSAQLGVDPKSIRRILSLEARLRPKQPPRCGGCGHLVKVRPCPICAAQTFRRHALA